jgi:hypothetical protein
MRLKNSELAKELPEILAESKHFQKAFLSHYQEGMSEHNNLLFRGMNQGLSRLIPAHKLMCTSIDSYLLRLHSDKISEFLESLAVFAVRILPIILDDTNACRIVLNQHILIHRNHWRLLGRRVLHLIRQICLREHEMRKDTPELWPNWRRLQSTASKAALVYARMMPEVALVQLAAPTQLDRLNIPATLRKVVSRPAAVPAQRRSMTSAPIN